MSRPNRATRAAERQERQDKAAAVAATQLRSALEENRQAERLQRQVDELETREVDFRHAQDAEEDRLIAEEEATTAAELAEQERRAKDEPSGSMEWAVRRALAIGATTISSEDLVSMPTSERERLYSEHRELWDATIERHGTEAIKALVS
jgi:hypothetical protein